MTDVAAALRKLEGLQMELAHVQDALAGPRMRWRRVVDSISKACIDRNHNDQIITAWRPLGADNIDRLNSERAIFLAAVGDLPEQEKTLKAAVRTADIEYRQAQKAAKSERQNHQKRPPAAAQMSLF